MSFAQLAHRLLDKYIPLDNTQGYSRLDRLDGLSEGDCDMLEHTKHNYYIDIIYCPQTHTWADLNHRRGDTDPGMDECGDCGELFEVKDLAVTAA